MIPGLREFAEDLKAAIRSGKSLEELMKEAGSSVTISADLLIAEAKIHGKSSEAKHLAMSVEVLRLRLDEVTKKGEEKVKERDEVIENLQERLSDERNKRSDQQSEFWRSLRAIETKLASVGKKAKKSDLLKVVMEAREMIKKLPV